jgi:adenylate cyclase class 2
MTSTTSNVQHSLVELKAKADDLAALREKLISLGARGVGALHQVDTYYCVPEGRLKLREVDGRPEAELIYYEREDIAGPKRSTVFLLSVPRPQTLKQILKRILSVKTVIDKVREIYLCEGIQVHLDAVKGLGSFIEFECLTTQERGQQQRDLAKLEKFRQQLNIGSESLEKLSYSDLT